MNYWWLIVGIMGIFWVVMMVFVLSCCVVSARADRRVADEQELRDVDEWLERMWEES